MVIKHFVMGNPELNRSFGGKIACKWRTSELCSGAFFFVPKGCVLMFNDVFQYNDVLSKSHLLVITSDLTMIPLCFITGFRPMVPSFRPNNTCC